MSEFELCTFLQKKKKSISITTTSLLEYMICSYNINCTPVESNWMIHIPSACYIFKSELMLEERMANQITIACLHFALCYELLNQIIRTLGLSALASCIGCTVRHERICTSYFGIPPSLVQREHSSRKSSQWGSVVECRYWIKLCISYTLLKRHCLLPHVVRNAARTSLTRNHGNPRGSCLTNSQKTCFLAVGIFKKHVSQMEYVIIP